MRLAGRPEIRLDAQVEGDRSRREPAPAPRCHGLGFGNPHESQEAGVEGLGLRFPTRWHGQLHVIEPDDREAHDDAPPARGGPTWQSAHQTASLPHDMGSLIKKRRKRMRKKKHKKMLKATRWQRRAGK